MLDFVCSFLLLFFMGPFMGTVHIEMILLNWRKLLHHISETRNMSSYLL